MRFFENYTLVQTANDLPPASAGVRTLPDGTAWLILGQINIGTDRIACQNVRIDGIGYNMASITTSNAGALIAGTGSFNSQTVGYFNTGTGTLFDLNGSGASGVPTCRMQWVLSDSTARLGTVKNYTVVFFEKCLFLSCLAGLTVDGSVNTTTLDSCGMSTVTPGATLFTIPSTFATTGRIRLFNCQFLTAASTTGLNISTSATISQESLIVHNCSFSTTGTPITGVLPTDLKAFFKFNRNINNSSTLGQYYVTNNATATAIAATNTFVKIAGTTTVDQIERFTHTSNRLTYTGMQPQEFLVFAMGSLTSNSGNEISVRIAKNGSTITASETIVTAGGAGQYTAYSCQVYVTLQNGDYVEVFTANTSAVQNVTARILNVAINAVG